FGLVVQLQDAEIVGSSFTDRDFAGKNNPYHDPFDINVAYVSFRPNQNLELKMGRQIISLGDRRVFGPGQWGNTGRYAWDALVLTYKTSWFETTFLGGRFIIHDPDRWPNKMAAGPTAWAIYASLKKLPLALDLFYVYKWDGRGLTAGETGTGNLASHSLGFRIDGHLGAWDYDAIYASQFGRWGADRLRAYGLVATLGYNFKLFRKTTIQAMYVLGSGDSNPTDGRHQTFDGLFSGADTVMYDWMTLFFWKNLRDYRLNLITIPAEGLSFRAEYHNLHLAKAKDAWYDPGKVQRRDETGMSGRNLGQELDLVVQKKLLKNLEVLAGYCFFFPGRFIELTGPAPKGHWFFLQTTLNF
ncbi:MAG: alginate export family protein, partial [Candidatus Saccharicenans sp.]